MTGDARLPVGVLTGFLGSGKTTLLRRWLHGGTDGVGARTAVLVNEFGAVGLDHLLMGRIAADMLLLDNGCICCGIRGELRDALWRLYQQRERGELPPFERVLVETTGLAAPGPMLATLIGDAQLRQAMRPAFVATVVDARHATAQMQRPEWLAQVAAADRLYLSKTDLIRPEQAQALRAQLARLNPLAKLIDARHAPPAWRSPPEPNAPGSRQGNWLARAIAGTPRRNRDTPPHGGVQAICLETSSPVDWCALTLWLTMLLHHHGERLLRLKGLVGVAAEGWPQGQPTVLHGIGHLMQAPEHLAAWPDGERRSRLVLIASGLDPHQVHVSWQAFLRFFT